MSVISAQTSTGWNWPFKKPDRQVGFLDIICSFDAELTQAKLTATLQKAPADREKIYAVVEYIEMLAAKYEN